ncbi:alpha/beta fold hydrolase [Glaciecola sp. 33A]|jgi:pimeloyl-ACP methyl ester carboxylesterase|uniref:alpha/beta fold hydrolase n=1 Tax=Glaciecola sp. 33A TaxID=2057807 RepID=UPI000C348334|nr:alpha/beta hydrolase [Glaciecola sp. 33A]PKI02335.1 alpha/beta hydrolase [Glaciecola sp. 33A]
MNNDSKREDRINVNGVDIAYQLHGDPSHPTLLLIHGLSTPLTGWPSAMIKRFVAAGYQVLLLDNRDVGRSQRLDHLPSPNMLWVILKLKLGMSVKAPYQLDDMMQDVVALLDALNLPEVHVVGASMGGMIAQLMAIHYPLRVKSLTSIMSTTGYKKLPPIDKNISRVLMQKPASSDYKDRMDYHIKKWQVIGSPNYPSSDTYINEYVDSILQRGVSTKGTLRQFLAIMVAANRQDALAKLSIPSLVIHGDRDGLVNVAGGKATAEAIPNATLKIYPGMGHDLPVELIENIVDDIVFHINTNLGDRA